MMARSNEDLQRILVERVSRAHLGVEPGSQAVDVGPLVTNYYSVVFSVAAHEGNEAVFVKIPKADLRRTRGALLPFSTEDERLAAGECEALGCLARHWQGQNVQVEFVELLECIPEHNAIVTRRADAEDGYELIRRWDLRRRLSAARGDAWVHDLMRRTGVALRRFHDRFSERGKLDLSALGAKLQRYVALLPPRVFPSRLRTVLDAFLDTIEGRVDADLTLTLKGLDVRNILVDGKGKVFLLDPGRLKRTCPEADIARFLMTYRILHWGHAWFALGLRPDSRAQDAFLGGYGADGCLDAGRLRLQFLKETLKHWTTARDSLSLRGWPRLWSRAVGSLYIDRFYLREMALLLAGQAPGQ